MSEIKQEPQSVLNTRWMSGVIRMAGKVLLYLVLMGVVSLLAVLVLMVNNLPLRIALNSLLLAGMWLLLYGEGGARGQKEVAHSHALARRKATGAALSNEEIAGCYHPMRGVMAALLGVLPFLLMAIALSVLAKPITYTLQSLPSWLKSYTLREDIGGALQYYDHIPGAGVATYLSIAVRFVIMPISSMASAFGDQASLLLERLSPLLVLLLPLGFAVGYLTGPSRNRKELLRIEEAKRVHKKKIARKKKREQQAKNPKGPERLI